MNAAALLFDRLVTPGGQDEHAAEALAWLRAHDLPDRDDEAWRYTPVDRILAALATATVAPVGAAHAHDLSPPLVSDLAGDHGHRIVLVNGACAPHLSDPGPAASWIGGGRPQAVDGDPGDGFTDAFDALNAAASPGVTVLRVPPGAALDSPVHIVHVAIGGRDVSVAQPRIVIDAGEGSDVSVVESYVSLGDGTLTNASTRLVVGEAATVTHRRVQAERASALHVGSTRIDLAARSSVRSTSLQLGGAVARGALDVRLCGADARVELDGLYAPVGEQWHDNVVTVDHLAPRCASTQRFHGIVGDRARGCFTGHVIVRPGAGSTDAKQTNRNLVLSRTAQADTRPWLEILADDVRCAHGATVGRLDEEALFYLRSRGIPLAQSRAMLVAAFAADVLDAVTPWSLREQITAMVANRASGEPR